MKRSLQHILSTAALVMIWLFSGSCSKDIRTVYVAPDSVYSGSIQFVLKNNPAQDSLFYRFLLAGYDADTLSTPGPFTVFAPTNNALGSIVQFDGIVDPHQYVVAGSFPLGEIPPGATEVLTAQNGYKIFVTGYSSGGDTVYTANGSPIRPFDQRATNGLIQVIQRPMFTPWYPTCLDYLNSNVDLAIFAYAVKRAHLDSLLSDSAQAYSVLAPSNAGMNNAGYSLEVLAQMDSDSVAAMVENHIIPGRYFLNDYEWLYQGNGDRETVSVTTLSGNPVQVVIMPFQQWLSNPTSGQLYFYMNQNQFAFIEYTRPYDVPAGIGTVQEIDAVLKP